ncbi:MULTISPECIES: phosphonate metabolism protein/1,5-bisphosphokinase (PRPP-forming) PhnN [Rhizobium]|uniref:Ribose 1,5-bisphosphate phosphokinase PhnN n=1 Tax=Rhizobium rhododendri TaxID=2506430 RepID=A0ABY8IH80_9HYPH|nr:MULTISPECIES: phosphonate metabolism protein/1,5-bisphosphokinase (PRPP-forming) PhnN [Rhizobium]MBZ5763482.1 phosphonate metabolism protein/1,5-bisphosphokinase (PRPP-forming) PhnN [Rhizobium sp. VS19-DR96]MBZ5767615.1 phosphonate metabolism protein/1,5-bisphosphokinase (PRPP-forming) PhnN [Rhizobium sp. VS19-DR129.2]MBZ5775478.1 phosphonate metabolism protein/1,5-bisphosphokinase (PRPP-forming) PhnN [Rhizobium sp. VS19-DRK62.2]MBZ5786099.1 phosphonate metabolism protein/1,5-bisphosphokinas
MAELEANPQTGNAAPTATGMMVVVVGPSGAGKDTLIGRAAEYFDGRTDVHFARRVITRGADAGGEDHVSVSEGGFDAMERAGSFAISWDAHGLKYGIPAAVRQELAQGNIVIANGSRSVLDRFKAAFPRLTIINVTARPEVLAERLEARGRETRADILKRLERGSLTVQGDFDVVTIDNSGTLDAATHAMIDALEAILRG